MVQDLADVATVEPHLVPVLDQLLSGQWRRWHWDPKVPEPLDDSLPTDAQPPEQLRRVADRIPDQ